MKSRVRARDFACECACSVRPQPGRLCRQRSTSTTFTRRLLPPSTRGANAAYHLSPPSPVPCVPGGWFTSSFYRHRSWRDRHHLCHPQVAFSAVVLSDKAAAAVAGGCLPHHRDTTSDTGSGPVARSVTPFSDQTASVTATKAITIDARGSTVGEALGTRADA